MNIIKLILTKITKTFRFFTRKNTNLQDIYALKSGLVQTGVKFGTPDYNALHYLLHEFMRLKHVPSIDIVNRNLSIEIEMIWNKGNDKYFLLISIVKFSIHDTDTRYSILSNFEVGADKSHVVDHDVHRTYSYWGDYKLLSEIADNLDASVNDFIKARK